MRRKRRRRPRRPKPPKRRSRLGRQSSMSRAQPHLSTDQQRRRSRTRLPGRSARRTGRLWPVCASSSMAMTSGSSRPAPGRTDGSSSPICRTTRTAHTSKPTTASICRSGGRTQRRRLWRLRSSSPPPPPASTSRSGWRACQERCCRAQCPQATARRSRASMCTPRTSSTPTPRTPMATFRCSSSLVATSCSSRTSTKCGSRSGGKTSRRPRWRHRSSPTTAPTSR